MTHYLFHPTLLCDIQNAFLSATVTDEAIEFSAPTQRDYFFIRFTIQPTAAFDANDENNLINLILSGDKKLSEHCNQIISTAKIELGFRWNGLIKNPLHEMQGISDGKESGHFFKGSLDPALKRGDCASPPVHDSKKIIFHGFCIKIIYAHNKTTLRNNIIHQLCTIFQNTHLIALHHDLIKQFSLAKTAVSFCNHRFYKLPRPTAMDNAILNSVKAYINQHIPRILPAYMRPNESGINPAYQDASSLHESLQINQKKIWLFRGDFILAIGNKNAYWISFSESDLSKVIGPDLHRHINWEDRYGHPSLACEYPGYNSSAFYGGLLAQRNGFLEIYTSSGRYYRNDLNDRDKKILESYLAYVLQNAYGQQPIVFCESLDNCDYFECALFYYDQALPAYCLKRTYDFNTIQMVFQAIGNEQPCLGI